MNDTMRLYATNMLLIEAAKQGRPLKLDRDGWVTLTLRDAIRVLQHMSDEMDGETFSTEWGGENLAVLIGFSDIILSTFDGDIDQRQDKMVRIEA